jgi:hypothetical protein
VALAPFFERVYGAVGGHLQVSRESLKSTLEKITVGVKCGAKLKQNDMWIAELSTNLLSRLYPRIAIIGSEPECSSLRNLATRINPNIELVHEAPGSTTLCVGSACVDGGLYPHAGGWVASVIHSGPRATGARNPYSAATAATLACAEMFRRIFLKSGPEQDFSISLLDFSSTSGATLTLAGANLGEVQFVGVGAIGNAALWVLAHHEGLQGRLSLVDPEKLTLLNLQRYVLGFYSDASRPKVILGQEALVPSELSIEKYESSLEDYARAHGGLNIPTLCISVDNVAARRSAQALLPRLVINGWTGEQALGSSWHIFSKDAACLACLYHPHGPGMSATEQAAKALGLSAERAAVLWVTPQTLNDDDIEKAAKSLGVHVNELDPWRGKRLGDLYTDVVCGAIPLDVAGVGRVETVPLAHQSVLAGILMAVELLKRTHPKLCSMSQPETLVSWDDILRPPPRIWCKPRAREKGCICGDEDYQGAYKSKWEGRYVKPRPRSG